jgi:uncharacterized ferritin-like protein (DUF455 family)
LTTIPPTLLEAAIAVLNTDDAAAKCAAAERAVAALSEGAAIGDFTRLLPPTRPARPPKPVLTRPADVPRRRLGSLEGRIALLHAIAHIEFNAIDLAFDMAARFASEINSLELDSLAFLRDWFSVGGDEARHFGLIADRLSELGSAYGDFPAHNGLWETAENTSENLLARMVVAPLILEARGLDVTPGMIARLRSAGDNQSAAVLEIIFEEEISHVACGKRWFHAICNAQSLEPAATFHALQAEYFAGGLKPPFNHEARERAGLARELYDPI